MNFLPNLYFSKLLAFCIDTFKTVKLSLLYSVRYYIISPFLVWSMRYNGNKTMSLAAHSRCCVYSDLTVCSSQESKHARFQNPLRIQPTFFRIRSFKWKRLLLPRCDKDQHRGGIWWEQEQRSHLGWVGLVTELVLSPGTIGIRTVSSIDEGSWSVTFLTLPSSCLSFLFLVGFFSKV